MYSIMLTRLMKTAEYVQRLRSILGIVYKSVMKQGPKYTCLSLTKIVEVEDSFRLFSHMLQLESTVLKVFIIKLVIFGIF